MDRWKASETPQMIESTLRRLFLLTFSPTLKYSLGQSENILDFRALLDRGVSVIYNLGRVHDPDARRLLGCLITIGYEHAALSRAGTPPSTRRQHRLILDEFADYSAQSEEALARALSGSRKMGFFTVMAHQTWSQASIRLQGTLQNVGVKIALRVGRSDAELLARTFGQADPLRVKSEATYEKAQPGYLEIGAQWEEWTRILCGLPLRHAVVRVGAKPSTIIKTLTIHPPKADVHQVQEVKRLYREKLLRPKGVEAPGERVVPEAMAVRRTVLRTD